MPAASVMVWKYPPADSDEDFFQRLPILNRRGHCALCIISNGLGVAAVAIFARPLHNASLHSRAHSLRAACVRVAAGAHGMTSTAAL
jgi:hypothetical protein